MNFDEARISQFCEQQQTIEMDMPPPSFKERMDRVREMVAALPALGKGPHLVAYTEDGQQQVPLEGDMLLGSDPGCDLALDCDYVSRRHCRVVFTEGDWGLEDAGSTNGTYVNGEPIQSTVLKDGDQIRVGTAKLLFLRAWRDDA